MSNSEKAVETIFATEKRIQGHTYDLDEARVRAYAQALADAGLLAPDLPKPTTIAEGGRGATWGRDVQVWVEDGGDRVWVELGDMTISHTIESARKHGNRLLAAANLAERNHAEEEA